MYKNWRILPFCLMLAVAGCATHSGGPALESSASGSGYLFTHARTRAAAAQFIQDVSRRDGFSQQELTALLSDVAPLPAGRLVPDSGLTTWQRYRAAVLSPKVVAKGAAFMAQNREALAKAEATYHVPAEVIAAIIGVETRYGANLGRYKALDALANQAFSGRRQGFYRNELEQYLLLCRENHWDPRTVKSSSAGALGLAQFEPSSYRHIAVDFDGDGKRDLMHSPADAIGSIAHYFALHGWQYGQPVATQADARGIPVALLSSGQPQRTEAGLTSSGLQPAILAQPAHASLYHLDSENGREYWLLHANFHVIMTYNHSHWYAMAVHELSQALKQSEAAAAQP